MDRSSTRRRDVPTESRLTVGGRGRNRRRVPLRERLPELRLRPKAAVAACGRLLRRSVPVLVTVAAIGATAAAIFYGHRFVTTSSRFAIDTIDVRGASHLTDAELLALIPIAKGDNVFGADLDAVEAALEREPWILDASVERRLPRTIEITVRERTAAAAVDLDGYYLSDADGHLFKRARLDLGETAGLPVITGLARDDLSADPAGSAARIQRGLSTAAAWAEDARRPAVGEIRIDLRHGVTLYTYDGAVAIRLGDVEGDALTARLGRFDAAWAALTTDERRRARAIHLDHDTRPDHVTVSFTR